MANVASRQYGGMCPDSLPAFVLIQRAVYETCPFVYCKYILS